MGSNNSTPAVPGGAAKQPMAEAKQAQSACPIPESFRNTALLDIASQAAAQGASSAAAFQNADTLNPANNMPLEANQQPCPGQRKPLSTYRVQSTIPKAGSAEYNTWLFPSPQMFFNALKRKGKGDDVSEEDMDSVVQAHNRMNEATWGHVQEWERLHVAECANPRLLRFQGKPDELSVRARWRSYVKGEAPFDRHDWVVDRCGKEVRYIIDFYFNEAKAGTAEAFNVDVRPAPDCWENVLDRVKMTIYRRFAEWGLPCPVTGHSGQTPAQQSQS